MIMPTEGARRDQVTEDPSPSADDDAGDPLASLAGHLREIYAAARLHLGIMVDEALGRLYSELFIIYLTAMWVLATLVLTVLGAYYLVSGVALGIGYLTDSPWIGHAAAGLLFLACPVLIGYGIVVVLQGRRVRRLERKYQALHQLEKQP